MCVCVCVRARAHVCVSVCVRYKVIVFHCDSAFVNNFTRVCVCVCVRALARGVLNKDWSLFAVTAFVSYCSVRKLIFFVGQE